MSNMDEEGVAEEEEVVDYNPIPRPSAYGSSVSSMKYSDNSGEENDSVDSDSGNDSDTPNFRAKKPKLKKKCVPQVKIHNTNRNNKYNIWSSELQETSLTEELVYCDVKQRMLDTSRAVESYDYKLAYRMDDQQESEVRESAHGVKRRYEERGNVKLRLGKRSSNTDQNDYKGSPRNIFDLHVTVDNTDEEVASDIANKLCEEKDDLILKVVDVLGRQKAIDIFKATKKIEEDGGMMVLNNSRRRTPGGVFFLLVKKDDTVQHEKLNMIFSDDKKKKGTMRKYSLSHLRKEKADELRRSLSAEGLLEERDLPTLLTRSELQIKRDKNCETDGVTNPPPSPVTDGRENSSDGVPELTEHLGSRQLASYNEDDFLDVTCDNMDVF
ncbi:phosphorylated adapter RNA export protein [Periplaneta americana]|uniref:phosphorylated adapter RNA export protein n=1 Tax=Periplaneta americana TaxID=6978 RepID=UPI0037E7C081